MSGNALKLRGASRILRFCASTSEFFRKLDQLAQTERSFRRLGQQGQPPRGAVVQRSIDVLYDPTPGSRACEVRIVCGHHRNLRWRDPEDALDA
jgi:hypothetical protein